MNLPSSPDERILIGRLLKPWGIRGWLAVYSYADPPEALFDYKDWQAGEDRQRIEPVEWHWQGSRLVVRLQGVDDRTAAEALAGTDIHIDGNQLPDLDKGQFYWKDLLGMTVIGLREQPLGEVVNFMETGAHDVLVVEGPSGRRLIPWVYGIYVQEVDKQADCIRVNWDSEWDEDV